MITERQGFEAMRLFLERFYKHAGNDMQTLLADIGIEADDQPLDPAAWSDWLECVAETKNLPG